MSQFRIFYDISPDEVAEMAIRTANEALMSYGLKLNMQKIGGGDSYEDYCISVESGE